MVNLKMLFGSIAIAVAISVSVTYSVTRSAEDRACAVSQAALEQRAAVIAQQLQDEQARAEAARLIQKITSGVDTTPKM